MLVRILLRWAATAGALLAIARFVPGIVLADWTSAFIAALALGFVNAVIKPVVRVLSLPIRMLTLGLFSLVINVALFGLAAYSVDGFEIMSAQALVVAALVYGVAAWLIGVVLGGKSD